MVYLNPQTGTFTCKPTVVPAGSPDDPLPIVVRCSLHSRYELFYGDPMPRCNPSSFADLLLPPMAAVVFQATCRTREHYAERMAGFAALRDFVFAAPALKDYIPGKTENAATRGIAVLLDEVFGNTSEARLVSLERLAAPPSGTLPDPGEEKASPLLYWFGMSCLAVGSRLLAGLSNSCREAQYKIDLHRKLCHALYDAYPFERLSPREARAVAAVWARSFLRIASSAGEMALRKPS